MYELKKPFIFPVVAEAELPIPGQDLILHTGDEEQLSAVAVVAVAVAAVEAAAVVVVDKSDSRIKFLVFSDEYTAKANIKSLF